MVMTFALAVIMMAALFLMLLSAVGFIQQDRFFTTAPKEIQAVIQPKEERFPGQHIVGWIMMVIAVIMLFGPLIYGAFDGIRNGFSFGQFFLRFALMFLLVKAYDIIFFDWFLLCRSHFFTHFYPEAAYLVGPHLFGFNKFSHMREISFYMVVSLLTAFICTQIH